MKEISCRHGKIVKVDNSDFICLSKYKWYEHKSNSAYYPAWKPSPNKVIFMHHMLIGKCKDKFVDHIDRDTFNNQRGNLRFVTYSESCLNRRKKTGTLSKYRGVSFDKETGKWLVQIYKEKRKFKQRYATEVEAALAYNKHVVEIHGTFSQLNIITEGVK